MNDTTEPSRKTKDQDGNEAFILLQVAGATYGIRSRDVQHIDMPEGITPVPNRAPCVEGVVFSRGQVISVMNLRARFGFEKAPRDLRTRMLVVRSDERIVGLLADSAREFLVIPADAIEPLQEAIAGLRGRYLEGIATLNGRIVLILDLQRVLELGEEAESAAETDERMAR